MLPAGKERVTFGKIPAHGHISGDVLSGVDGEISRAHSMHGGLKNYDRRHHQRSLRAGVINSCFLYFGNLPASDYQLI